MVKETSHILKLTYRLPLIFKAVDMQLPDCLPPKQALSSSPPQSCHPTPQYIPFSRAYYFYSKRANFVYSGALERFQIWTVCYPLKLTMPNLFNLLSSWKLLTTASPVSHFSRLKTVTPTLPFLSLLSPHALSLCQISRTHFQIDSSHVILMTTTTVQAFISSSLGGLSCLWSLFTPCHPTTMAEKIL